MREILIGTHNAGKIKEYKILLKDMGFKVLSLDYLDIREDVIEDGNTYKENAIKKASFYAGLTGLSVLADDGGLEIDALEGEPGIKSRRWPGHEASDEELIKIALRKLKNVPKEKRTARFVVVVALAVSKDKVFSSRGEKEGVILEKTRGKMMIPGYPFRSLFFLPDKGKTFNQISLEEEAEIGHRKKALSKLEPILKKL
ncbi:MAG: non-canonical purine NTP pyrophosphatase [Candidatus Nealsonbacteria bacterium]|nr:non-canonical purine NTP pyrophosphatase [Candidatus Nealsonbacteria bacterium]